MKLKFTQTLAKTRLFRKALWLTKNTIAVFAFLTTLSAFAQTLAVENVIPESGLVKTVNSNQTISFPTAGAIQPTLSFTIRNVGTATLNITTVNIAGANPSHFNYTQPDAFSIDPSGTASFIITYTPPATFTPISTATLTIVSNSTTNPNYNINLAGGGASLYGPTYPPFGNFTSGFVSECPEINNCIGRSEGTLATFNNLEMAGRTDTYRSTHLSPTGDVWIRCSLNDNNFTGAENFSFSAADSDLPNGIIVHRGESVVPTVNGDVLVYMKYIETYTRADTLTPFPLTDPTSIGLSEDLGGLAKFADATDGLNAHTIITASDNYDGPFLPLLDFYEAIPEKFCNGCAFYTINKGFYWSNLAPQLTANAGLTVPQGESMVLTTDMLNAHDDEELPDNPQNIVFDFNNTVPLPMGSGELQLNGVALGASDSFTLQQLQLGLVTYTNNGAEISTDSFQFRVRDSKGLYASDAGFTVFNFNITIEGNIGVNSPNAYAGSLSLQPNPVQGQATLQYHSPQTGRVSINLFAPDGRNVATLFTGAVIANVACQVPLNTQNLPAGIYLAIAQTDSGAQQQLKVVVLK